MKVISGQFGNRVCISDSHSLHHHYVPFIYNQLSAGPGISCSASSIAAIYLYFQCIVLSHKSPWQRLRMTQRTSSTSVSKHRNYQWAYEDTSVQKPVCNQAQKDLTQLYLMLNLLNTAAYFFISCVCLWGWVYECTPYVCDVFRGQKRV